MKKILSLVLALLMTISAASFVGAAGEAAIAEDTAATTTASAAGLHDEAIAFLESYGIYKGTSTSSFEPDAYSDIQRYQMALFVARVSTGWVDDSQWAVYQEWNDGIENRSTFDDLGGTYAEKVFGAISYAAQKGIIEGYGNNKFGPTDGITYQDALTMVVRTLGYKGLAWPWGYIEKAVTLDLTRGIPSTVAYTDILNRGQVAQIIYNALFATTKEGDTLAARNFGGELGWANIIITAVGKAVFSADEKAVDKGIVAFRVVNEDGTLGERYLVKNEQSFKFDVHVDRYIGHAYNALFTKDENSEYATLIGYKDLFVETVWNFGLRTKEDGTYPIEKYVKDFTLVSKFSKDDYLNKWNGDYGWKEFIMKNALQGAVYEMKYSKDHKYGINWTTGDILMRTLTDSGDFKDEKGNWWVTRWNWNSILDVYFETLYKIVDGKAEVVGINILDPDEIAAMAADKIELGEELVGYMGLNDILDKSVLHTAYASLDAYVLGKKTTPNYGLFEEYRFGYIELYDKDGKAWVEGKDKAAFKISNLNGITEKIWKDFTKEDFPSLKMGAMKSTYVDKTDFKDGAGWYSEDSLVDFADIQNGSFIIFSYDRGTGELKVVKKIYAANDPKADKDNFVATGVVRAYNVNAKTVTIGDTTYGYDYPELAGNGLDGVYHAKVVDGKLYAGDGALLDKAAFTYLFKSLFNQYVMYVVVDGKLVYITASGKSSELIVVDSYAGLSNDGYIVVNGYKTDDLSYAQYRIASYNNWVKGDYYYYPTNIQDDQAFARGTIYAISSYDASEDAYYVQTVALGRWITYYSYISNSDGSVHVFTAPQTDSSKWTANGTFSGWNFDYSTVNLADKGISVKLGNLAFDDGYKLWTFGSTTESWERCSASDTYILVCNPVRFGYAPIIVYTGVPDNGWSVSGYKVSGTSATVILNAENVVGFNLDQWDLSYVVFLTYDYETASYDGANYDAQGNYQTANGDPYYLLGASDYNARVFNLYNGKIETRHATNKDLKKGYVYTSIGDWIVQGTQQHSYWTNWMNNQVNTLADEYTWPNLDMDATIGNDDDMLWDAYKQYEKYVFLAGTTKKTNDGIFWGDMDGDGAHDVTSDKYIPKFFDSKWVSEYIVSPLVGTWGHTWFTKTISGDVSVFLVKKAADGRILELNKVTKDEFAAWLKTSGVDPENVHYNLICEVGKQTVIYVEWAKAESKEFKISFSMADQFGIHVLSRDTSHGPQDEDTARILVSGEGVEKKTFTYAFDGTTVASETLNGYQLKKLTFTWADNNNNDDPQKDPHGFTLTGEGDEAILEDGFEFGKENLHNFSDWAVDISVNGATYKRVVGAIETADYDNDCKRIKAVTINLPDAIDMDIPTYAQYLAAGGIAPTGGNKTGWFSGTATTIHVRFDDKDETGEIEWYDFDVEVRVDCKFGAFGDTRETRFVVNFTPTIGAGANFIARADGGTPVETIYSIN